VLQVLNSLEGTEGDRGCMWLPFFHDMGLITALLAAGDGQSFTFMTPAAFVRRPAAGSANSPQVRRDRRRVFAAPNFAFEHAACAACPATTTRRWT